ncbi:MAG: hypothetical protein IT350_08520, partial [Deltaproteobacteria bacterium]|nr:hypothetical protein [Deltaproteobacteria bacterium]
RRERAVKIPVYFKGLGPMFREDLKQIFDDYYNCLSRHMNDAQCIGEMIVDERNVSFMFNGILEILETYLDGKQAEAFEAFGGILNNSANLNSFYDLFRIEKCRTDVKVDSLLLNLYRCRTDQIPTSLGRRDMFHIPFSRRKLVGRQRYSVPGLPCLYLGGSVYTCWTELGEPPLHSMVMSRFELLDFSGIYDFGYSTEMVDTLLNIASQWPQGHSSRSVAIKIVKDYIELWPLLLALSLDNESQSAPFIHEYIFPQMFLQWALRQEDFVGIRYLSNRVCRQFANGISTFVSNYVFPARGDKHYGDYSETLRERFLLTDPLPWSIAQSVVPSPISTGYNSDSTLSVSNRNVYYGNTEFYQMESRLSEDSGSKAESF